MKTVVKGLNSELEPIEREILELKKNPMSEDLIAKAEEYNPPEKEEESEAEIRTATRQNPTDPEEERKKYLEKKRKKEFRRRKKNAAEQALEKVLNSSLEGMPVEKLEQQLQGEGFSEGVVKASIEKLQNEDQIRLEKGKILSRGASRAEGEAYQDDEIHDFLVEKVRQGRAVLEVDDKWKAVLYLHNNNLQLTFNTSSFI